MVASDQKRNNTNFGLLDFVLFLVEGIHYQKTVEEMKRHNPQLFLSIAGYPPDYLTFLEGFGGCSTNIELFQK